MKSFLSITFLLFTSFLSAQIDLTQANKLGEFIKNNADSSLVEGDAKVFKIFYPLEGYNVKVVYIYNDLKIVLEITKIDFYICENWCVFLDLDLQQGNIYSNYYAIKYLPANRMKKENELNSLIKKLCITKNELIAQKDEHKKLINEFQKWLDVPRTFEEYLEINEDPFWKKNRVILIPFDLKGDLSLYKIKNLSEISMKTLKEMSEIYFE